MNDDKTFTVNPIAAFCLGFFFTAGCTLGWLATMKFWLWLTAQW